MSRGAGGGKGMVENALPSRILYVRAELGEIVEVVFTRVQVLGEHNIISFGILNDVLFFISRPAL